jgi:hypothetical protein
MKVFCRRWLLPAGLVLSWAAMGASQATWNAQTLMENLASVREAEFTFTEQRTSTFLMDEIRLSGRLHYRAPDFIRKTVISPFEQVTTIEGDSISIEKTTARGESTTRHYSLNGSEALHSTVEGIRATLSGNYEYLQESFDVELSGDSGNWSVMLVPRDEDIRKLIEKICITGMEGRISAIDTINADGDESRLQLSYQKGR